MRQNHTLLMLLALAVVLMLGVAACADDDDDVDVDDADADPAEPEVDDEPDDETDEEPDEEAAEPAEDLGTVRVAHFAVAPFAPMFLAAEKYADEVGITVEMTALPTGPEILTGVATGEYDVGGTGIGAYVYNAHVDELPFELVAYQHMDHTEVYWLISSTVAGSQEEAEELAEDLSALEGETVATVTPGGSTTYMLELMLQRGGLAIEDVEVDYMAFPDMLPALESGAVAAATVPEPLATSAIGDEIAYRAFPDEADWTDPIPMTAIAYNSDWAAENEELAEAYMRAFHMAVEDLEQNGWQQPEVLDIASEYTDVPAEALGSGEPSTMPEDLDVDFDLLREFQEFFLRTDTLNYTDLLDDEELWNLDWRDRVVGGN